MSPEPFDSRAKAPPAKRWEKGYGDENAFARDIQTSEPAHRLKIRKSDTSVERVERRHKSSLTSSSPSRKTSTVNINRPCMQLRSLLRQNQKENFLPAEVQFNKPKKNVTSSIEVRQSFNSFM